MNFDAIASAIQNLKSITGTQVLGNHYNNELKLWVKVPFTTTELANIHADAFKKAFSAAANVLNRHLADLRDRFDAEARGAILEARQEVNPDAHLEEITKRFGAHQGLNANWAVMAWHLGGLVWLTDDENGRTVSLVTRSTGDDDTMCEIASQITPAHALRIWAMISEEGR